MGETNRPTDDTTADERPLPAPATPHGPPPSPFATGIFGAVDPVEFIERANQVARALTDVILDRKLYTVMGRNADGEERRHVNVEGWTLLGSMVGLLPYVVHTAKVTGDDGAWSEPTGHDEDVEFPSKYGAGTYTKRVFVVDSPGRGGWEARVEARTADGRILSAADSECRWSEPRWATSDSYALRSMAQTRATSRALATPLRFIVELAGFESTPAEEMTGVRRDDDAHTGPRCPACSSPLYDNTAENIEREAKGHNPRPAFKCSNRACTADNGGPWITWDADYFRDARNKAKANVLAAIDVDGWLDRYGDIAGGVNTEHPMYEAIVTASVSDDVRLKASVLWADITDELNVGPDDIVTIAMADRIGVVAQQAMIDGMAPMADVVAKADDVIVAQQLETRQPALDDDLGYY